MTPAKRLVQRYSAAGSQPPPRLLAVIRRTVTGGHPEYQHLAGAEDPHLFTFKSSTNFSIAEKDLRTLLRMGMSRIQVNDPGKITLYFSPLAAEGEMGAATFKQMGRDAFAKGRKRVPANDPALAEALKGINGQRGAVLQALTEWTNGWDEANLAAPVT